MVPDSPMTLFWSIRGEVSCANHAPHPASDRWASEGWVRIPDTSIFSPQGRPRYQCQRCDHSGRALIHYQQPSDPFHLH